jgi:hypothetical protein
MPPAFPDRPRRHGAGVRDDIGLHLVFRTWLDDDDAGLARTMAALDRRLRSGEQSLQTFDGLCDGVSRILAPFLRGRSPPPAQGTAASGPADGAAKTAGP